MPTSPTAHPFQQRSPDFYPSSHAFQPYRDDQWSPKESPLPITIDNASDTVLSMHNVPSNFPFPSRGPLHQYQSTQPFRRQPLELCSVLDMTLPHQDERLSPKEPLPPITFNDASNMSSSVDNSPSILFPPSNNLTPFPAAPTSSSSLFWGPSLAGTSTSSPTYGNRATSTKSKVLSYNDKDMTTCLHESVPLHLDDPKGWRSSEFEDRVTQVIKRVTGGVTEGEATGELDMIPATTLPSPIVLRPTSRIQVPSKMRSPSTASRSSSTTSPPSSTMFQPSSMVLPLSMALCSSSTTPFSRKRRCSSVPPPFY